MLKKFNQNPRRFSLRKLISISISLCGIVSTADFLIASNFGEPYHRTPCCDDGGCVPNRITNGYYPTHWRPWPGSQVQTKSQTQQNNLPLNNVPKTEPPVPKNELDKPNPIITAAPPVSDANSAEPKTSKPTDSAPPPPSKLDSQTPKGALEPLGPATKIPELVPMSYQPSPSQSEKVDFEKNNSNQPARHNVVQPEISIPNNTVTNPFINTGNESDNKSLPTDEQPNRPAKFRPAQSGSLLNLFDNNPKIRSRSDDHSSITPESLESTERSNFPHKEPLRINVDTARNVLNIQEPEPAALAVASTSIRPLNSNVASTMPVVQSSPKPVQRANFLSSGNETNVKPIAHQTPVVSNSPFTTINVVSNDLNQQQPPKSVTQTPSPEFTLQTPPVNPLRGMSQGNPLRKN